MSDKRSNTLKMQQIYSSCHEEITGEWVKYLLTRSLVYAFVLILSHKLPEQWWSFIYAKIITPPDSVQVTKIGLGLIVTIIYFLIRDSLSDKSALLWSVNYIKTKITYPFPMALGLCGFVFWLNPSFIPVIYALLIILTAIFFEAFPLYASRRLNGEYQR